MFKKFAALAAAAALSLGVMTGCGVSGTTADSTGYSAENPLVLTLAHGLSETHTVHIAMTQFADEVAEKTDGRIRVKIFPNGQLGSENENLEQLQAGVIAMTKVSAPGLATYNDAFNTFGLPYIFNDTDDFYHVMDSQEMQDFFLSTGDDGFVTLTYYTSGARSFYTKDRAIRTPADLKGLKIRVQDMLNDHIRLLIVDDFPRLDDKILRVQLILGKHKRGNALQNGGNRGAGQAGFLHQLAHKVVAHIAQCHAVSSVLIVVSFDKRLPLLQLLAGGQPGGLLAVFGFDIHLGNIQVGVQLPHRTVDQLLRVKGNGVKGFAVDALPQLGKFAVM